MTIKVGAVAKDSNEEMVMMRMMKTIIVFVPLPSDPIAYHHITSSTTRPTKTCSYISLCTYFDSYV